MRTLTLDQVLSDGCSQLFPVSFLHGSCLGNADVTVDDRLQHETGTEEVLHLLANDLVEIQPLVEHCCKHKDFQSRVVCFADSGDGLEQLIHAQQGKTAGVYGDYDRVRDDQGVYGGRPHGRRRVYEDDIEVVQDRLQLSAQEKLAIDLLCLQEVVGLDVEGVGQEIQLGTC